MSSRQIPEVAAEFESFWRCTDCGIFIERDEADEGDCSAECENCGCVAEPVIVTGDIVSVTLQRRSFR